MEIGLQTRRHSNPALKQSPGSAKPSPATPRKYTPARSDDEQLFDVDERGQRPPAVGSTVSVRFDDKRRTGTVKYVGELIGKRGTWAGVELRAPDGKNDGSLDGQRYFECAPGFGLFCRLKALQVVHDVDAARSCANQQVHEVPVVAVDQTIGQSYESQGSMGGPTLGDPLVHLAVLRDELDESRRFALCEQGRAEAARRQMAQLQIDSLRAAARTDASAAKADLDSNVAARQLLVTQSECFEETLKLETDFYRQQLASTQDELYASELTIQQQKAQLQRFSVFAQELQDARGHEHELAVTVAQQSNELRNMRQHHLAHLRAKEDLKLEGEEIDALQDELMHQRGEEQVRRRRSEFEVEAVEQLRQKGAEELRISVLSARHASSIVGAQRSELHDTEVKLSVAEEACQEMRQQAQDLSDRCAEQSAALRALRQANKFALSAEGKELDELRHQQRMTMDACQRWQEEEGELACRLAEKEVVIEALLRNYASGSLLEPLEREVEPRTEAEGVEPLWRQLLMLSKASPRKDAPRRDQLLKQRVVETSKRLLEEVQHHEHQADLREEELREMKAEYQAEVNVLLREQLASQRERASEAYGSGSKQSLQADLRKTFAEELHARDQEVQALKEVTKRMEVHEEALLSSHEDQTSELHKSLASLSEHFAGQIAARDRELEDWRSCTRAARTEQDIGKQQPADPVDTQPPMKARCQDTNGPLAALLATREREALEMRQQLQNVSCELADRTAECMKLEAVLECERQQYSKAKKQDSERSVDVAQTESNKLSKSNALLTSAVASFPQKCSHDEASGSLGLVGKEWQSNGKQSQQKQLHQKQHAGAATNEDQLTQRSSDSQVSMVGSLEQQVKETMQAAAVESQEWQQQKSDLMAKLKILEATDAELCSLWRAEEQELKLQVSMRDAKIAGLEDLTQEAKEEAGVLEAAMFQQRQELGSWQRRAEQQSERLSQKVDALHRGRREEHQLSDHLSTQGALVAELQERLQTTKIEARAEQAGRDRCHLEYLAAAEQLDHWVDRLDVMEAKEQCIAKQLEEYLSEREALVANASDAKEKEQLISHELDEQRTLQHRTAMDASAARLRSMKFLTALAAAFSQSSSLAPRVAFSAWVALCRERRAEARAQAEMRLLRTEAVDLQRLAQAEKGNVLQSESKLQDLVGATKRTWEARVEVLSKQVDDTEQELAVQRRRYQLEVDEFEEHEKLRQELVAMVRQQDQDIDQLSKVHAGERQAAAHRISEQGRELDDAKFQRHEQSSRLNADKVLWEDRARRAAAEELQEAEAYRHAKLDKRKMEVQIATRDDQIKDLQRNVVSCELNSEAEASIAMKRIKQEEQARFASLEGLTEKLNVTIKQLERKLAGVESKAEMDLLVVKESCKREEFVRDQELETARSALASMQSEHTASEGARRRQHRSPAPHADASMPSPSSLLTLSPSPASQQVSPPLFPALTSINEAAQSPQRSPDSQRSPGNRHGHESLLDIPSVWRHEINERDQAIDDLSLCMSTAADIVDVADIRTLLRRERELAAEALQHKMDIDALDRRMKRGLAPSAFSPAFGDEAKKPTARQVALLRDMGMRVAQQLKALELLRRQGLDTQVQHAGDDRTLQPDSSSVVPVSARPSGPPQPPMLASCRQSGPTQPPPRESASQRKPTAPDIVLEHPLATSLASAVPAPQSPTSPQRSPATPSSPKGQRDSTGDDAFKQAISVPKILVMAMPAAIVQCAGQYSLVDGRLPNGYPLWKQEGGDHFMFSGVGGRWFIGDGEEEELNFVCNAGVVVSAELHRGAMPDSMSEFGGWQRFNGAAWVDDAEIIIAQTSASATSLASFGNAWTLKTQQSPTAQSMTDMPSPGSRSPKSRARHGSPVDMGFRSPAPLVPELLCLIAPAMQVCSGQYELVPDKQPNGQPYWKQQGGSHFIFSGIGGRWFVGDDEEEHMGFACNAGIIVSRELHRGVLPDRLGHGKWQRYDGTTWFDDPSISVCAATVISPSRYPTDEDEEQLWRECRKELEARKAHQKDGS